MEAHMEYWGFNRGDLLVPLTFGALYVWHVFTNAAYAAWQRRRATR